MWKCFDWQTHRTVISETSNEWILMWLMRPNMHSKLSHQSLVYCLLLSFYGTDANHYGKQGLAHLWRQPFALIRWMLHRVQDSVGVVLKQRTLLAMRLWLRPYLRWHRQKRWLNITSNCNLKVRLTADLKCKASHCTKGCFCEPGFYRDFKRQGQCVRALDCQALTPRWASTAISGVKCPPNQEFKCGSNCGRNCDDIGKRVSCPESCESGCYCRDGYYRESSFKSECVKEKYCKKKIQKKLNSKKKEFTLWFKRHIPWKS